MCEAFVNGSRFGACHQVCVADHHVLEGTYFGTVTCYLWKQFNHSPSSPPSDGLWLGSRKERLSGCGRGRRSPGTESEGVRVLESHEALSGTVVRVMEGHRKNGFSGMRGTIQELWVSYAPAGAAEVLLEDGSLRLFWLRDLVVVDEGIVD